MGYLVKLFFATLAVFLVIDMIWLGLVARSFYRKHLGFLMSPSPKWIAAIIFYLLFIVGLLVFVVVPGLESGSLGITLARAALFGLVTYGTYDLTNQATLKNWPTLLTVVDLVWGTTLSVIVSLLSFLIGGWMA